jgi:hypothetical protein
VRLAPALEAAVRNDRTAAASGRKQQLSPARLAALRLQGRYMGHLRNLKPQQRKRVKALRARKGTRAAVALAKKLARA